MRAAVSLRDALAADAPAVAAIVNREIACSTAIWSETPRSIGEIARGMAERRARGFPTLVAERAGAVVGWGAYGPFRPHEGYRFTVEHSVYVAPQARGEGTGAALIEALAARAAGAGLRVMIGGIGSENEGSLRLHRRLGFVEAGRLPGVGVKFGRPLDLVLMLRRL